MSAGYSSRPLSAKLGLKAGMRVALVAAPEAYPAWLSPLPPDLTFVAVDDGALDFVHLFVTHRADLDAEFGRLKEALHPDGMLWVSWPKRAAKLATDLDENVIREVGLAHGLVDVKVAAVTEVWSGLKFVYRRADRPAVRRR